MQEIFKDNEEMPKITVNFDIDAKEFCYMSLNPLIQKNCEDYKNKYELNVNVKLNNLNFN